jgi:hypothetical protein
MAETLFASVYIEVTVCQSAEKGRDRFKTIILVEARLCEASHLPPQGGCGTTLL